MVFISHFAILFFTSKLCTGTLWFLYINVFYTLQGFHGYQICNIWPSILFYNDFTSCSRNLEFENLNSNEFWLGWPGGWRGCSTWPLLISWYRFGFCFYSQPYDLDPTRRTRWRGNKLTGERDSGESSQVVDGEGASVILEVDGKVYEERGASARFWAGSSVLGAASCGGCSWMEGLQASAARTMSLLSICCKEMTSEGMRECA
jgi:hypothetical protein